MSNADLPRSMLVIHGRVTGIAAQSASIRASYRGQLYSGTANEDGKFLFQIDLNARQHCHAIYISAHGDGHWGTTCVVHRRGDNLEVSATLRTSPMQWRAWCERIAARMFAIAAVWIPNHRGIVGACVAAALGVCWVTMDCAEPGTVPGSMWMARANFHIFRSELNGERTVAEVPQRVRNYQKITVCNEGQSTQVKATCEVADGGTLVLVAPLKLAMHPCVGIISKGVLKVLPSKNAPDARVRFEAATDAPWAGVVLMGSGASGSEIHKADFSGGSGTPTTMKSANVSASSVKFEPQWLPIPDASSPTSKAKSRVGGALLLHQVEDIQICESTFSGNSGHIGGAIAAIATVNVKIIDCLFQQNVVGGNKRSPGGAIYASNSTDLTVRDSRFIENKAQDIDSCGGAIYFGFNCTTVVQSSWFKGNEAGRAGGGIFTLSIPPETPGGTLFADGRLVDFGLGVLRMPGPSVFTENLAGENNSASPGGSDICVGPGYTVNITNLTIVNTRSMLPSVIVETESERLPVVRRASLSVSHANITTRSNWLRLGARSDYFSEAVVHKSAHGSRVFTSGKDDNAP